MNSHEEEWKFVNPGVDGAWSTQRVLKIAVETFHQLVRLGMKQTCCVRHNPNFSVQHHPLGGDKVPAVIWADGGG